MPNYHDHWCLFDNTGKRTETVLEGIHIKNDADRQSYATNGYVNVDDEVYNMLIGNRGTGDNGTGYLYVNGTLVSAPVYVQTVVEKVAELSVTYEKQISDLKDALATATLAGDNDLITSLKSDYSNVMTAYQGALKGVE